MNLKEYVTTKKMIMAHVQCYEKSRQVDHNNAINTYRSFNSSLIIMLLAWSILITLLVLTVVFNFHPKYTVIAVYFWLITLTPLTGYFIFNKSMLSASKFKLLIGGYLITISTFTLTYFVLSYTDPMHFSTNSPLPLFSCFYFSVVTISTVGYGDISPVGWVAESFVLTEILLGIMYMIFGVATIFSGRENDEEIYQQMKKYLKEKDDGR